MAWLYFFLSVSLLAWIVALWKKCSISLQEQETLSQELEWQKKEKKIIFSFLHDLGEAFTENIDHKQLLKIILRCAENVCDARGGAVYLWDERKKNLKAEAVFGVFPPPFLLSGSVAAKVARKQNYLESTVKNEPDTSHMDMQLAAVASSGHPEAVAIQRIEKMTSGLKEESLYTSHYLEIPINYRTERLGVLALANRKDGGDFSPADFEMVKSIGEQAAFALHNAQVYSQLADKKQVDQNLKLAREIQRILLPSQAPKISGYDFCALNLPAQQVSGDYYDFIQVDENHWGIVIADVSGKGVPASLIMTMCRSVLRISAVGCLSPSEVLRKVNRELYPDIHEEILITMIYMVLDFSKHKLKLARAGHEPPLLAKKHFDSLETLSSPGLALGIDDGGVFDDVIEDVTVDLEPEDALVLYTDGINEACGPNGQEFGRQHIEEIVKKTGPEGVDPLAKEIMNQVRQFSSGHRQNDDITLAILQRSKR